MSEIQPVKDFALSVISNPELKEAIQANFEGADEIRFERVKMPSGGGLSFETLGENGEAQPVAELSGIIVDKYRINTRWEERFSGEVTAPLCVSLDARHGVGDPGGDCRACQFNQWGSGPDGRGKACKNLHRVYLLPLDRALPKLITMPPTSLGNFESYMRFLSDNFKPFYTVVTRVKLEKATNKGGIQFSRAVLSRIGEVPKEHLAAVKGYIETMRPLMRAVKVESDDYNTEEADSAEPTNQPF